MLTYICSAQKARLADETAIHVYHFPSIVLMENAALKISHEIEKRFSKKNKVFIACGPGNNGGDGMAVARILFEKGYPVFIFTPNSGMSADEGIQFEMIQKLGIPYSSRFDEVYEKIQESTVIVDALFGSGLSREISGIYLDLIEAMNTSSAYKIAVDICSGLNGTTGQIMKIAFKSDLCLCLDCIKEGLLINQGPKLYKKIKCLSIQIPQRIHQEAEDVNILLNKTAAKKLIPYRSDLLNKGKFGKALMIGGSINMHGALCMAAEACYHSGIGTLTLMIPDFLHDVFAIKLNCCMLLPAPSQQGVFSENAADFFNGHFHDFSQITIGNGMKKTKSTEKLVEAVLKSNKPVILDADAIGIAGKHKIWLKRKEPVILTPHVKEMADLCGCSIQDVLTNPLKILKEFTSEFENCTVVLKSDITFIADSKQCYSFIGRNSALSKGGSGDVLCGIISGLFGQCQNPIQSAAAGVYLHAKAASYFTDPASFQPEDIIRQLGKAFKNLR